MGTREHIKVGGSPSLEGRPPKGIFPNLKQTHNLETSTSVNNFSFFFLHENMGMYRNRKISSFKNMGMYRNRRISSFKGRPPKGIFSNPQGNP
jgi:hypothetical protein